MPAAHPAPSSDPAVPAGRRRGRTARPRVLDLIADQVREESGDSSRLAAADRVAVLAHWSARAAVSRSFRTLVDEFQRAGYAVVVVSASPVPGRLDWADARGDALVVRKPNVGYDFGSWAVALDRYPEVAHAQHVVLANDSLVGPFGSIAPLLERFENCPTDVWGLTDTRQYFHHLQSYFLGFRRGVLEDAPLQRFWRGIREEPTKWDVISRGELKLSRVLRREAYGSSVAFLADGVVPAGDNPVIKGWWRLLEQGFPFVKREILTRPEVAPRSEWVGREVRATWGANVSEWL